MSVSVKENIAKQFNDGCEEFKQRWACVGITGQALLLWEVACVPEQDIYRLDDMAKPRLIPEIIVPTNIMFVIHHSRCPYVSNITKAQFI